MTKPYEIATTQLIAVLTEAFPPQEYEIKMEETDAPGGGASVKLQLPENCALVFSVTNQTTTAYLSVPSSQAISQLMGVKANKTMSLYRETLRNDPQGTDDAFGTGWLSMVIGMPEFPKNESPPLPWVKGTRMPSYKVTKTTHLFDAAKNRSVELKKHEVLAWSEQYSVLAQVAVDNKTAYGLIRLIDQRFQAGINKGIFSPLPGDFIFLDTNEIREVAGLDPIPPSPTINDEVEVEDEVFPLGNPR